MVSWFIHLLFVCTWLPFVKKLTRKECTIVDDEFPKIALIHLAIGHPTLALLAYYCSFRHLKNLLTVLLHAKWRQHLQMDLIRLIKPLHTQKSFCLRRVSPFELIKPLYSSIPDLQFVLLRALKIRLYIFVIFLFPFSFIGTFKCILFLSWICHSAYVNFKSAGL